MKRLAIIGASGLLGRCLHAHLRKSYDVIGTCNANPAQGLEKLDICVPGAYNAFLDSRMPDIVVHCAALTDLERCEHYPDEAYMLNVKPVQVLAEWAVKHQAKVVLISTDSVFDGRKGMYIEADAANPVTVYGRTKLQAEQALAAVPGSLTLRVAVLYGPDLTTKKFLANTIARLKAGQTVTGATDIIRSPTLTEDVAAAVHELLERDASGTYHAAGSTRINMYEAAGKIARIFGYDANLVKPILSTDIRIDGVPSIVRRAGDTSLDCTKLAGEGMQMRSFEEGLRYVRNRLLNQGLSDNLR